MSNYQPAPAGAVTAEIVAASLGDVKWKASDDNPRGECLRLRLSVGREFAFVFVDVPLDWGRMLENVRAAADASSDITPEEFIGRRVRVVLKHYTAKDGTTRATVTRWLPAARPATAQASDQPTPTLTDAIDAWAKTPAAGRPASKPSRNALPRHVADDEIPF